MRALINLYCWLTPSQHPVRVALRRDYGIRYAK